MFLAISSAALRELARSGASVAPERTREVTLMSKADHRTHFGYRQFVEAQEPLCRFDPLLKDVLMRRHSGASFKRPQKVKRASIHYVS